MLSTHFWFRSYPKETRPAEGIRLEDAEDDQADRPRDHQVAQVNAKPALALCARLAEDSE